MQYDCPAEESIVCSYQYSYIYNCVCCISVNPILIVYMSVLIKVLPSKYLIIIEICPNEVFYYIPFVCVLYVMFYLALS